MNNSNSGPSDRPTTTTTSAVEATKTGRRQGQCSGRGRGQQIS